MPPLSGKQVALLAQGEDAVGVAAVLPFEAWAEYAMREGLLDTNGIAPDRQKTGTAFAAFAAGWNAHAANGVAAVPHG